MMACLYPVKSEVVPVKQTVNESNGSVSEGLEWSPTGDDPIDTQPFLYRRLAYSTWQIEA
eukprot:GABW01004648.1.p1 GENE.GABW01004648.1~~GABW01004648.1.p1  ORF type:complete len:60 (-),score=9.04 GABW01004648.1:109-288(-)